MATTRFISMHIDKGKSIAESIKCRTDYAKKSGQDRWRTTGVFLWL
jgi:hypothetical protein